MRFSARPRYFTPFVASVALFAACGNSGSSSDPSGGGAASGQGGEASSGGGSPGGAAGDAGGGSGQDDIATVYVSGATVEIGVVGSAVRRTVTLTPFSVTRHPITVGEYRECGECGEPELERGLCNAEKYEPLSRCHPADTNTYYGSNDDVPVTCLSSEQMVAYCASVGGTPATLGQWLLAARGEEVVPYPWGYGDPTVEQHPYGDDTCVEEPGPVEVGKHPLGAGPSGMEDVLVAPAEFAVAQPGADGFDDFDRYVDSAEKDKARGGLWYIGHWISPDDPESGAPLPPMAFRCVWSEQ